MNKTTPEEAIKELTLNKPMKMHQKLSLSLQFLDKNVQEI